MATEQTIRGEEREDWSQCPLREAGAMPYVTSTPTRVKGAKPYRSCPLTDAANSPYMSSTLSCRLSPETTALLLYDEHPDRSLLTVAKLVVYERKFPRHLRDQLEDHPAAGRNIEGLHTANGVRRWCTKVDDIELRTDDVKGAWYRRTGIYDIEAHPITELHADWFGLILSGTAVEGDIVGQCAEHLCVVEWMHAVRGCSEIELVLHEHELFRRWQRRRRIDDDRPDHSRPDVHQDR